MKLRARLRDMPGLAGARLLRLNILARLGLHQDFAGFVRPASRDWRDAIARAQEGPRVLVATSTGGHFAIAAIDRLLAVALTLRGAQVTSAFCDGVLPACMMCEVNLVPDTGRFARHGPPRLLCAYCHAPAAAQVEALGLPVARLGETLTEHDHARAWAFAKATPESELAHASWEGLPVGEHAHAGALRYLARGSLGDEPHGTRILRRYLAASVLTAIAYGRLMDRVRPAVVVAHHGIYVPQGMVAALARARGIRAVTWNPAYRRHCFIFSHDDTYHHTLMDEPVARWAGRQLDPAEREATLAYLESRADGRGDWIRFHAEPETGDLAQLALDPAKPTFVAYTNVFWDAQLHYPANAFADQRAWLLETVRWFAARPDLQLVIRVHPAEITGSPSSRQRAADEIAAAFSRLPANVTVVPPDSPVSSYALARRANAALIYGTKMGVELTALGIPVIVAGEAWVRNKGITHDAATKSHYLELLSQLPFPGRIDGERRERAIAYAHHFFFRRMIPLPLVVPEPGPRRFTISAPALDRLAPGADPGLDAICEGILQGTPFEYSRVD